MSRKTWLITGIPRSGTTLCCKLINQRQDSVALHEPINPSAMPQSYSGSDAVFYIQRQIDGFSTAIEQRAPFEHGDKGGLNIENPVGMASMQGIRQVVAQRGQIQLPARSKGSYQLVIKQNALFTALLPELSKHYPVVCIVRNPIDVLLSWLTVNLPVNRGHIPAAERFDTDLKHSLLGLNCLQRQLFIYQWFISKFLQSGLPIIRYENIIDTNGRILDETLEFEPIDRNNLSLQKRNFPSDILNALLSIKTNLLNLQCGKLYSKEYIASTLNNINVS